MPRMCTLAMAVASKFIVRTRSILAFSCLLNCMRRAHTQHVCSQQHCALQHPPLVCLGTGSLPSAQSSSCAAHSPAAKPQRNTRSQSARFPGTPRADCTDVGGPAQHSRHRCRICNAHDAASAMHMCAAQHPKSGCMLQAVATLHDPPAGCSLCTMHASH